MNILYYGFERDMGIDFIVSILAGLTILLAVAVVVMFIESKFGMAATAGLTCMLFVFLAIFIHETQGNIPIIKTTIDDSYSWKQLNSEYKLRDTEGQIYTFEVLNVDTDEWREVIKEHQGE